MIHNINMIEVHHVFPDGTATVNTVKGEDKIKRVFKNLNKQMSLPFGERTSIGGSYRIHTYTGLGTNITNDNWYIAVYLVENEDDDYFMYFPQ